MALGGARLLKVCQKLCGGAAPDTSTGTFQQVTRRVAEKYPKGVHGACEWVTRDPGGAFPGRPPDPGPDLSPPQTASHGTSA
ncbi:hypothetical protein GCM10009837_29250 [Streptomyces durmitorensis]